MLLNIRIVECGKIKVLEKIGNRGRGEGKGEKGECKR
jgi:hypothetical protein